MEIENRNRKSKSKIEPQNGISNLEIRIKNQNRKLEIQMFEAVSSGIILYVVAKTLDVVVIFNDFKKCLFLKTYTF